MEIFQEFLAALSDGTLPQLGIWSYALIAILVAIVGPTVTLLAAFVASTGALQPEGVFLATLIGDACADVFWYLLGYLGRFDRLMERFAWLRKHQVHIQRFEQGMKRHAVKVLILAKLTFSLLVPALIAAGMARVPWRRWFLMVFALESIWALVMVVLGYYLGGYIQQFEAGLRVLAVAGILIFAVLGLWYAKRSIQFTNEKKQPVYLHTPKHRASHSRVNGTTHRPGIHRMAITSAPSPVPVLNSTRSNGIHQNGFHTNGTIPTIKVTPADSERQPQPEMP